MSSPRASRWSPGWQQKQGTPSREERTPPVATDTGWMLTGDGDAGAAGGERRRGGAPWSRGGERLAQAAGELARRRDGSRRRAEGGVVEEMNLSTKPGHSRETSLITFPKLQSQYLITPSHPHVATLLVSKGCHSHPMQTPLWHFNVLNLLQLFQSQNQQLPSPSPDITNLPSGEKFT